MTEILRIHMEFQLTLAIAVSDWPLLNALLNTASGTTWVSLHHGSGVMRHADADYDIALATVKKQGLKLPMAR